MATTSLAVQPPALNVRRRWTVLAICALSLFLVGLDTTIVNVGLPSIGRGLGAGTRSLEWVVDAYTVVFASLLISSGALADRFGRRRVFQCGLAVFGAASLASALAPSWAVLVAARAIQGAGASMLSPVALAIVVNAMPDPRSGHRRSGCGPRSSGSAWPPGQSPAARSSRRSAGGRCSGSTHPSPPPPSS